MMNGHLDGKPQGSSRHGSSRTSAPPRDSWADGLRGISCVLVVTCHASQAFFIWLLQPTSGENQPPHLFQLPFLRIPFTHGRCVVAIFFILTGYVNALKPIRLAREDDKLGALSNLARSAFNRPARLMLPAIIITIITWFVCQLGFFELALSSDSHWMRATGGDKSPSWPAAIGDLIAEIIDTWFFMNNYYDQPQWTMMPLLKGSMWVLCVLFLTIYTKPAFRLCVEIFFYIWSYCDRDCLTGINVFSGLILAELSFMYSHPKPFIGPRARLKNAFVTVTPFLTAIIGLYLMSYPDRDQSWLRWSRQLQRLTVTLFPPNSDTVGFMNAIGSQIFTFSIFFSPTMRRALSKDFLYYLGQISFPLYLIHGPMMRSLLAWMAYGPDWLRWKPEEGMDPNSKPQNVHPVGPLGLIIILPVFWSILFTVVHHWTMKMEPLIAKAAKRLEAFARD